MLGLQFLDATIVHDRTWHRYVGLPLLFTNIPTHTALSAPAFPLVISIERVCVEPVFACGGWTVCLWVCIGSPKYVNGFAYLSSKCPKV